MRVLIFSIKDLVMERHFWISLVEVVVLTVVLMTDRIQVEHRQRYCSQLMTLLIGLIGNKVLLTTTENFNPITVLSLVMRVGDCCRYRNLLVMYC